MLFRAQVQGVCISYNTCLPPGDKMEARSVAGGANGIGTPEPGQQLRRAQGTDGAGHLTPSFSVRAQTGVEVRGGGGGGVCLPDHLPHKQGLCASVLVTPQGTRSRKRSRVQTCFPASESAISHGGMKVFQKHVLPKDQSPKQHLTN